MGAHAVSEVKKEEFPWFALLLSSITTYLISSPYSCAGAPMECRYWGPGEYRSADAQHWVLEHLVLPGTGIEEVLYTLGQFLVSHGTKCLALLTVGACS